VELSATRNRFLLLAIAYPPSWSARHWQADTKPARGDVAKLCPNVPIGSGKIIECLKKHKNQMTVGCAKELKSLKS
jgi:hypothetical protein